MRVLIIDDHPLIGQALGLVLQQVAPGAEIEHAGDCERGLTLAATGADPDLLLLDLNLPGLSGLDAVRHWRQHHPAVPVVVLSADHSRSTVLASLRAGACGFIPKSTTPEVLRSALRIVLDGGRYLPPEVLAVEPEGPTEAAPRRAPPLSVQELGLTERQLQVLGLVARGAPNKVISRQLGLAERTVKAHVTAALRALKVSSRTQLALAAARLGLETPERTQRPPR